MIGLAHSGDAIEVMSGKPDYSDKQSHCNQFDPDPLDYGQLECDALGSGDAEADFDARDAQFDAGGTQWEELR